MLTHFSLTQQGQKHIEKQISCQDYSASRRIHLDRFDCDIVLAAIADGVGSCEYSEFGSKTSVNELLSYLQKVLENKILLLSDENIGKLLKDGFEYALLKVEELADEKELPFLEFDSTLTAVIYDGENLWFGHIGDDGLVVLYTDGSYEMITARHKGEEANSVYPLRNKELWQFGKTKKKVASLVLMTDGILDYCVDSKAMGNRVYFPFLEPALTEVMDTDEKAEKQKCEWEDYFYGAAIYEEKIRKTVTDDISFVVVENSNAVMKLPEIEFDFVKWQEDTRRRRKQLDDILYADYYAHKAKISKESVDDIASSYTFRCSNDQNIDKVNSSKISDTTTSQKELDTIFEKICVEASDAAHDAFYSAIKIVKSARKLIYSTDRSERKKCNKHIETNPKKRGKTNI